MVLLSMEDSCRQAGSPRAAQTRRGNRRLSGFLIDGRLREAAQQSFRFFFFLQGFIEQTDRIFKPQLSGPGFEGAVA